MSDKQFCGTGRVYETKYGPLTKVSFTKDDLELLIKNVSENGWVTAVVKEKKNKVEGKPTHYLEVDNWKPDGAASVEAKKEPSSYTPDEMPF